MYFRVWFFYKNFSPLFRVCYIIMSPLYRPDGWVITQKSCPCPCRIWHRPPTEKAHLLVEISQKSDHQIKQNLLHFIPKVRHWHLFCPQERKFNQLPFPTQPNQNPDKKEDKSWHEMNSSQKSRWICNPS